MIANLTPVCLFCRKWEKAAEELSWGQSRGGFGTKGGFSPIPSQGRHVFVMLVRSSGQTSPDGWIHKPTCTQLCFSVFTVVYCMLFFALPFTVKCTTKMWFQIEHFIFWLWWKRAFHRRKMKDCSFIHLMQVSIILSSASSFSTVVSYLLVRVEFWLNDPSFAKHVQAMGKN